MISMTTMSWIQIVLSIVLITTILIQRGSSGAGSALAEATAMLKYTKSVDLKKRFSTSQL